MPIIATALTAAALALLPVHAGASTPNASPEQTKAEAGAVELSGSQAASTPSAEPAAADTKKPSEQTVTQTLVTAEPKPDQSAQSNSTEHGASPAES